MTADQTIVSQQNMGIKQTIGAQQAIGTQQTIGERIRHFRESKKLSLSDLAKQTGLALDFLQGMENDSIYPAIGPLQKIARVLGVRLGTFLDDQISHDPIIRRASEIEGLGDPALHTGKMPRPGYCYYALGKGKSDRNMEPFILTIQPNQEILLNARNLQKSHEGEEFIYVLEGELLVLYGNEQHILKVGDCIYYNASVAHLVYSATDKPVRILAVSWNPWLMECD